MSKSVQTQIVHVQGNPNYTIKTYTQLLAKLYSKDFWKKFPLAKSMFSNLVTTIASGRYISLPLSGKALDLLREINQKAVLKGNPPVIRIDSVYSPASRGGSVDPWLFRLRDMKDYYELEDHCIRLYILTKTGWESVCSLDFSDYEDIDEDNWLGRLMQLAPLAVTILYHDQLISLAKVVKSHGVIPEDIDHSVINADGIVSLESYEPRNSFEEDNINDFY